MTDELFKRAVTSQFDAALLMLARSVELFDDGLWLAPVGTRAAWEVAFHTAAYTSLYSSRSMEDNVHPAWAGPFSHSLGRRPEPPHDPVDPGLPLDRGQVAGFIRDTRAKVHAAIAAETPETLAGPSGFPWVPFSRAELHLYNLRHVQHHTGQLAALLGKHGRPVDWVGMSQPA